MLRASLVEIVECPRDAWQGLARTIPPETKAAYLRQLIDAGFKHIDAVSFVSPTAVPQMADSERVLELLGDTGDAEIIGIVVNEKGAHRAIATGKVRRLGFPYSISREFLRRNQNQTLQSSLETASTVRNLAQSAGLATVVYVSMAFGNPYGDRWSVGQVLDACHALVELGVRQISLADTVGLATPWQIEEVLGLVDSAVAATEVGVHLHARDGEALTVIKAAYAAGCRRFDSAIGGLGGCPFAQDALVGNLPTEVLLAELKRLGAELPEFRPLDGLVAATREIERKFGTKVQ